MFFDTKLSENRPILYLSKPDRTTVARLSEARQETESFNGGQLNELSFVLPLKHQTLEENKKNLHAEMIRERMFVRLEDKEKDKKRFYVIAGMNFDTDNLTVTVQCKSLAYTLSDIPIKGFTTIDNAHPDGLDYSSWTPSEIIRATVDRDEDTPWSLGEVDADLDLKRREFTFDGSLGELINSVAEKFGAVVEYDDNNYKINLRDPEKVGRNRGLKMSERNYLKSLSKDTNADSMVTQLALYGKDGLTIHDISPTGSPYIEDFSHFLYPYEEDAQGNIVKSSYFMSDSLAKAMVAYNRKIKNLSPTFDDYVRQLDDKMQQVTENENLKADLDIQLTQVQEQIDIHLALNNGESNTEYETNKSQILTSVLALETVISGLKDDISALAGANYYDSGFVPTGSEGGQIGLLKEQMLVRNNFTPSQIAERSHFIIRKEWTNDSIIDSKDLLEEGKKQLKEMIKPNISMTLGLLNFLSIVDAPKVVSEFHMFDTIRIEEAWNKRTSEVKIVGFSINYDTKDLNVTVANVKDNNDGTNKFLQMLYQSSFAATVVNENKHKWDLSQENNGQINALINQNFDAIKRKVTGGVAGLTEFSARGVISRDYEDQNKYLVLQNGVLATTKDGGVTWGHAITPDGIVGERIFGKILAGVNLTIEDADGMFRILGNKGIISNRAGQEVARLGLLSENGQPERFGFVVDNRKNQIGIEDKDGFFISRYQNNTLEKLLWTDANGNLNAQRITATDMAIVNGDMRSATVKDAQGNVIVRFGNTGMQINNGALTITGGLSDSNIASSSIWNAKETPGGAQAKVDAAKIELNQTISNVSSNLGNLETTITTTFKDGVISSAEALSIKSNIDILESQRVAMSSQYTKLYADTSLTGAAKTNLQGAHSSFVTAHNSLVSAINASTADSGITDAERNDVSSKFASYRTTVDVLQTRIEEALRFITDTYANTKSSQAESNAKGYTDSTKTALEQTISNVSSSLSGFENTVNTTFKDGLISNAEALSIKSNIDILNSDKESMNVQYTKVYNDALLTGTPKTNLASAKTAFDTSHTNLVNAINTATTDNAITAAERTDVSAKFTDYRAKLSAYQQRLDEAWTAVYNKYSEDKANQAKTDAITSVKTSLRVAADLPTSISMGSFGIRATTSDAEKYAQLDYRGLYVKNGAIEIDGGVNGVRLNATEGLVSESGTAKVSLSAQTGIRITKKSNNEDVFFVDANGDLNVRNIKILSGSITWSNVNNQPVETQTVTWSSLQGKPTYLGSDRIWSPLIQGGTIQGGSFINDNLTITDSQLSTYKQTALGKVSSILDYGSLRMKADYNYFGTPTTRDFSISYEINGSGGNNNADVFIRSGQSSMQILSNANIIFGANSIQFPSYGSLLWGSETVATRTWVTNTIANTYSFATESWVSNNFASKYHSHSEYIASGSQPTFSGVVSSSYKSSGNYNNIWSGSLGVTRILDSGGGQWGTLWGIVENKSSINYKTNLDKFDNIGIDALKLIEETQIWKFHYQSQIDQGYFDKPKVGVIAEMVHPIIRANDGVDSYSMVSVAWKAIQQLSKQVSELQEKVKLLEEIQ